MTLLSAYIDLMPLPPYMIPGFSFSADDPILPTPDSKSLFTLYQLFLPNFSPLLLPLLTPQRRPGLSYPPSAAAIQSSFTSSILCIPHICPSKSLSSSFLLLLFFYY